YYWSFVDNYEWNHGFDLRFGLFELDGTTKERLPRDVLGAYAAIADSNRLE
ncbi:MAG: family 1 glycosylhydrolase, partial [Proteobacteria bacterium]|nr:family 1 glycosylhydrolase [Pseudomonadota bacterium]